MVNKVIKKLIKDCIESQDFDCLDRLEDFIRNDDVTLAELYYFRDDLEVLREKNTLLANELFLERSKVVDEYYAFSKELKKLDKYEDERCSNEHCIVFNSIFVGLVLMAMKAGIDVSEFVASLPVIIMGTTVVGGVTLNRRRLQLNNGLETIGDLDDLVMKRYNASERDKGIYDAMTKYEDIARYAFFCQEKINDVILERESLEEAKEYKKA